VAGVAVMRTELTVPGFVIIFFGLGCWGAAIVAAIAPDVHSTQLVADVVGLIATAMSTVKEVKWQVQTAGRFGFWLVILAA
jgi:hypothetical protein